VTDQRIMYILCCVFVVLWTEGSVVVQCGSVGLQCTKDR